MISAPLTLMLKIISGILSSTNVRRSLRASNSRVDDGDKVEEMRENLSKINWSRAQFLTPESSVSFIHLSKVFTKAPILYHLNPKPYIQIKNDASGFSIGEILN